MTTTIKAGERLFCTESGLFGFGSPNVKKGDLVCVFRGAKTAHIVRRVEEPEKQDERYHLVGAAYVHGMMLGEIVYMAVEEQDITLM